MGLHFDELGLNSTRDPLRNHAELLLKCVLCEMVERLGHLFTDFYPFTHTKGHRIKVFGNLTVHLNVCSQLDPGMKLSDTELLEVP